MRGGNDVGTSLVNGRMDREGGPVQRPLPDRDLATRVHQQQIRHLDPCEVKPERIDPEVVRQLRIAGGEWSVKKAIMSRSARVLMEGWVRVPGDAF